jgi:hypothetical protein
MAVPVFAIHHIRLPAVQGLQLPENNYAGKAINEIILAEHLSPGTRRRSVIVKTVITRFKNNPLLNIRKQRNTRRVAEFL